MRTTYELAVLEIEGAGEVLRARAEGGEQFRFVPELPFSVLMVDETAAIVDVRGTAPDGGGSLLVRRQPALVRSLAEPVETVWRLGTPARQARTAGLDRRDTAILTLLAAGASDAHDRPTVRASPSGPSNAGCTALVDRSAPAPGSRRACRGSPRLALSRAAAAPAAAPPPVPGRGKRRTWCGHRTRFS